MGSLLCISHLRSSYYPNYWADKLAVSGCFPYKLYQNYQNALRVSYIIPHVYFLYTRTASCIKTCIIFT